VVCFFFLLFGASYLPSLNLTYAHPLKTLCPWTRFSSRKSPAPFLPPPLSEEKFWSVRPSEIAASFDYGPILTSSLSCCCLPLRDYNGRSAASFDSRSALMPAASLCSSTEASDPPRNRRRAREIHRTVLTSSNDTNERPIGMNHPVVVFFHHFK